MLTDMYIIWSLSPFLTLGDFLSDESRKRERRHTSNPCQPHLSLGWCDFWEVPEDGAGCQETSQVIRGLEL